MGIYGIKPWFRSQLQPLIKFLWNVHPDVLTWAALIISLVCGVLLGFSHRHPYFALIVIPLLFIRIALNALDGMLAQQTGKARPAGEVLNEMTDRFADIAIYGGLALSPGTNLLLGLSAVISLLMVSYVGILGKAVGTERVYTGVLGKADRVFILMFSCLVYGIKPHTRLLGVSIFNWLFIVFIVLSVITIAQRTIRILSLLKNRSQSQETKS